MNQGLNCSNLSSFVHITQRVIYVPVFLFGVILNALALRVFCFKMNKWTETRVYMTNLALADCLFLFTLPFKIIHKNQHLDSLCLFVESVYFINRYMSIFLITITAVDRYIVIHYPLRVRRVRSPLKSAIICGFLWIFVISSISAAKWYDERGNPGICFQKVTTVPSVVTFAVLICGFLLPLIILSFCSIQSARKLLKKKTHSQEDRLLQKSINIIFANMVTFVVCFVPLHLAHFIRFIADFTNASCAEIEKIEISLNFAAVLANTNCCLDAICYYFVNKEFQEASLEPSVYHIKPTLHDYLVKPKNCTLKS